MVDSRFVRCADWMQQQHEIGAAGHGAWFAHRVHPALQREFGLLTIERVAKGFW